MLEPIFSHVTRPERKPAGLVGVIWAHGGRYGVRAPDGTFTACFGVPGFGSIIAGDIGKRIYRVWNADSAFLQVENMDQLEERLTDKQAELIRRVAEARDDSPAITGNLALRSREL